MSHTKYKFKSSLASEHNPVPRSCSEHKGTIVQIKDVNPSNHTLKVVRASDGQPLEDGAYVEGRIEQIKPYQANLSKWLKVSEFQDGAIVEVSEETVSIRGSSNNGFFSTSQFGNIIKGPTSFSAAPHEIRMTGVTTLNPLLTSCFPSTIVTPISTNVWSIPGASMLAPIAKDVSIMATLITALGVV